MVDSTAESEGGMSLYIKIGIGLLLVCVGVFVALWYDLGGITKMCSTSKSYPFKLISEWCKSKVEGDSPDKGTNKSPIEKLEDVAKSKVISIANRAADAAKVGVREVYLQKKLDASKGCDCTPYYKMILQGAASSKGAAMPIAQRNSSTDGPPLETENQFRCGMIKKKIESAGGSRDDKQIVGGVAFIMFAYLNREVV